MQLYFIFILIGTVFTFAKENDDHHQMMEVRPIGNKIKITPLISNGVFAKRNQFPYQVGMVMKHPKGYALCGGSLLSENYVLTASHCLEDVSEGSVYLGAHNIYDTHDNSTVMTVTQENFIKHPQYNDITLVNDIGFIKLPKPYALSDKNHYVKLPSPNLTTTTGKAIASGWGRYSDDKNATVSRVLRFVELNLMSIGSCQFYFGRSANEKNICTSSTNKKAICTGDSGGPLVFYRENDQIIQIGVASYISNRGCQSGYPSVFTRVGSYLDWIKNVTGITSK